MERNIDDIVIDVPSHFGHLSPIATAPLSGNSPSTRHHSAQSFFSALRPRWTQNNTVRDENDDQRRAYHACPYGGDGELAGWTSEEDGRQLACR